MSLEPTLPSLSDLGSISVVVLAAAAALLYFGKLIGDVKVEKHEKTADYYLQGLFFSLIYIVIPSFLVWLIAGQLNLFSPLLVSVITQVIIGAILSAALRVNFVRYLLFSKYKEAFQRQFKRDKEKKHAVSSAIKAVEILGTKDVAESSFKVTTKFCDIVTDTKTLFLISLLLIWDIFSAVQTQSLVSPEFVFLGILSFVNFTMLALEHSYVGIYHPKARIVLENGQEIKGRLVKVGDFVSLVQEDEKKKLFINSRKIVCVEEDMFKEEPNA